MNLTCRKGKRFRKINNILVNISVRLFIFFLADNVVALTRLAQVWDDGAPCRISFISFVSATTPFLECSDMQLWRITEQTFSVGFDLKIQRGRFLLSAFLNSILFPIWCWWAKGRFYIINRTYKSTVDKYFSLLQNS